MKITMNRIAAIASMLIMSNLYAEPGFNGTAPGCGGSDCHTTQAGKISVTLLSNLQVRITLLGITADVGGELVDANGSVVAVINRTSSNPFTLTAPSPGNYTVNAGYKSPSKRWDSTPIVLSPTDIGNNLMGSTSHSYKLENNYPNPFNPSTYISFSIPERSEVSLKIFDLIGNEVAALLNEERSAGDYSVNFNVRNLSSGIYFYKLEAVPLLGSGRRFSETKKMILTK